MTGHLAVRRATAWTACIAAVVSLLTVAAGSATAAPVAQASRTINVTERASLHLVKKSGSTIYQAGTATGTLPGTVTTRFKVTTKVTGSLKIVTRGGTLTMSVNGRPRSMGTTARFGGTMRVTGGTGRYARARGTARFEGVVNRRTWAATVTARGRLTY
ncbi:autotransporter [Conexibacter arvalis]|uniref:Uncharacterized protein n=1 Tax=Conexibacter arvalis TaxID=912552 RepID=A0A840IF18_9ACTN|nr:autotransporter [Conexibacter arvalis]MBB4662793.1 hypothetical protein [Conexibacter arvalis]